MVLAFLFLFCQIDPPTLEGSMRGGWSGITYSSEVRKDKEKYEYLYKIKYTSKAKKSGLVQLNFFDDLGITSIFEMEHNQEIVISYQSEFPPKRVEDRASLYTKLDPDEHLEMKKAMLDTRNIKINTSAFRILEIRAPMVFYIPKEK